MEPSIWYPFNVQSFFIDHKKMNIRGGLEIWRGYFQSIQPAIGKMAINLNVSFEVMYKSSPLINLCLQFFNKSNLNILSPGRGFPKCERLHLQCFLTNLRITTHTGASANSGHP